MDKRLYTLIGRYRSRHVGTLLYAIEESPLGVLILFLLFLFDGVMVNWLCIVLVLKGKGWYLDIFGIIALSLTFLLFEGLAWVLVESAVFHLIKPTVEIYQKTIAKTERKEKE